MSMKQALPWPRRATIRPATRCRDSVSTPGASPSCAARTSPISSRPENSCGDGSIPASRIRSSFSRRSSKTWESSCSCSCSAGSLIEGRAYRPSSLLDLGDFKFFLRAPRDLDGDDVVALFPQQRFADRRLVGELVLHRVRLGRADDLEFLRVAGFLIFDVDDRAEDDLVGADRLLVDHLGAPQFLLQLGDPPLEQGLFVLGVVVFGVLGDVAEFARFLDPGRDLPAFGRREELDLLFEFFQPLGGDDGLTHLTTSLWIEKGNLAGLLRPKKTRLMRPTEAATRARSRGIIAMVASWPNGVLTGGGPAAFGPVSGDRCRGGESGDQLPRTGQIGAALQ